MKHLFVAAILGIALASCGIQKTVQVPGEFDLHSWYNLENKSIRYTTLSKENIQNTRWNYLQGVLVFSEQGHYAFGSPRSGIGSTGAYEVEDNSVVFTPELVVYRYDEEFKVRRLTLDFTLHIQGSPVLTDDEDTVVFSNENSIIPEQVKQVTINKYVVELAESPIKVVKNGYLFSLPTDSAKNIFLDNWYGEKSTESEARTVGSVLVDGKRWYYCFLDFTDDEPTDGGGPFYQGWLPDSLIERCLAPN